jgi:Cys-rich repeat protein
MKRQAVFALLLFSACGSNPNPGGDGGGDLARSSDGGGGDLAHPAGCQPACGGATPHCNAAGNCVGCLADGDCPTGQVCHVVDDTSASCVDGCATDARCKPDGGGASIACCAMHCADTATDVANCGGCGKSCGGAHGKAECVAGTCGLASCDPHFDNCDGDPANGCETDLNADTNNCLQCGIVCLLANATPLCKGGCVIKSCDANFGDCDKFPDDGCEVDLMSDPFNCGNCGVNCPQPNHATPSCDQGNCDFACDQGWDDCDGDPGTGCEAELDADPANCGGCGNACQNGESCIAGMCSKGAIVSSDGSWVQTLNLENGWEQLNHDDSKWDPAFDEGAYPIPPWNDMMLFAGSMAHWLWYYDSTNGDDNSTVYFRKQFVPNQAMGTVHISVDDSFVLYLNGQQIDSSQDCWCSPHEVQVALDQGKTNLLAVEATNTGGPGGLLLDLF